ncbi:unnamed protein product [Ranitomeya imitator]|uniref:Uncharacterized protein n=1 Tax=Ranitomeya imitator TaxID=111125 RepID=A0ABN9LWW5_9NEOB|nr:unnamed protein product [Ranitomeya imitator]
MVKTKELLKDTRNKIVALHQAGKTESAIGKLHASFQDQLVTKEGNELYHCVIFTWLLVTITAFTHQQTGMCITDGISQPAYFCMRLSFLSLTLGAYAGCAAVCGCFCMCRFDDVEKKKMLKSCVLCGRRIVKTRMRKASHIAARPAYLMLKIGFTDQQPTIQQRIP